MKKIKIHQIILLLVFVGICSCKNDIEVINLLTNSKNLPRLTLDSVEIVYRDSGCIEAIVKAPKVKKFTNVEEAFLEFPDGIHITRFKKNKEIEAEVTSKYAKYLEKDHLWIAKINVVVKNNKKGEQLNTEELFWDENKEIIYSNIFTRITNSDGVFYGKNGFESDQYMNKWKLKGGSGTVNVKE